VELGRRQLNIYFSSVQTGQQNVSGTLEAPLTSEMCSRSVTTWWNSWFPQGICLPPPYRHWPDGLVIRTTTTTTTSSRVTVRVRVVQI